MKDEWRPQSYGDYLLMAEWRAIKNGQTPHLPAGYTLFVGFNGKPRLRAVPLATQKVREARLDDNQDWGKFTINPERQSA